jgi:hemolysin activation/secretion protein
VFEPGETPGATRLTYHVAEQKPWLAYAQVGNYGTESTTEWRERFGFEHDQLTGHDDILRLDYVTGNFDDVHAGFGSYEAPVWKLDRLRARAYGPTASTTRPRSASRVSTSRERSGRRADA